MAFNRRGGLRRPSVIPLGDILPQVSRDLALEEKAHELALIRLWATLIPEYLRERTRATGLSRQGNKTTLWVKASDSATAGELSLLTETLRHTLNDFFPQTGIKVDKIAVKVGTLSGI